MNGAMERSHGDPAEAKTSLCGTILTALPPLPHPCTPTTAVECDQPLARKPTLCGCVDRYRDYGDVIFIDPAGLHRHGAGDGGSGRQPPGVSPGAAPLRNETVLRLSGHGRLRPEGSVNPKLAISTVEVVATALTVLNSVKGVLLF